jgi:Protein of unknown function (DUF4038)/Putative collagen-binding domain of a collagenase
MKPSLAFIPGVLFFLNILLFRSGYPEVLHPVSYEDPALSTPPNTLSRLQVDRDNPRHFADTLGNPVLLIGDSPQNLPQKLTVAQMKSYFADCRSKGINLCWVCIDGQPTDRAVEAAPVDRKGNPEFFPGGTPANWDLSQVNPAYFSQTIDSILILAENFGIYINLMPMSQCYWSQANITANSPLKCFNYGAWLGKRYKNQRNILWLYGNDNIDSSRQCPIARGIRSAGDNHLMSIHVYNPKEWGPDPEDDARGESGNFFKHIPNSTMKWVTYNNLYSDMQVFNQAHFIYHEYMKKDIMPIIMSEGPYQKLSDYNWQVATNQVERSLNYRVALGGGFGGAYTYGCDWLQKSTEPWDKYLNRGARPDIKFFSDLFKDRPWWNLSPDWKRTFLISTTLGGGSDIENDNYTIAAFDNVNGKLGIVYCTTVQTVTIDLSGMPEPVTARWYDPVTGNYINISGSPFKNNAPCEFTTPRTVHHEINTDNSAETSNDWVLVLEAPEVRSSVFPLQGSRH